MGFDATAHLMDIKGKEYLEVKWRLVWFREEHPAASGWGIKTEPVQISDAQAVFHAVVLDPEGRVVASGTKSETPSGFPDFIEKAETGAIGRALALLGYGTQWCADELDEGERLADSPVERKQQRRSSPPPSAEGAPACPKCGKEMRKRSGKKGDFWGCTGYPDCRGTIDVGDEHNSPAPTPAPNPLPKEDDEEDPFGDDAPTGNVSRLDEPEVTDSPSLTAAVLALGLTPMAAVREVNAAAQSLWGTGMADIDNASMKPEHWRELYHEVKRTKEAAA